MPQRALLLVLLLACLAPTPAAAQDRFEIQVYDADTAARGDFGLELHANFSPAGTTTRSPDGELPTDHSFHFALEPHIGLTRWLELGGYLQAAANTGGRFDFGGVKLRAKVRVPFRIRGVLGLALNGELSYVPALYEANVYGSEIRPILDVEWRFLYFSINPIVGIDLAGPLAGRPQFEPAARLSFRLPRGVAIGPEYYAALGPVTGFLPLAEQVHRLFGVIDYERGRFSAEAGLGYGLAGGERWIIKLILGANLGR